MEIKYTFQGLLIYIVIGVYLLAFLTGLMRCKKTSQLFFLFGFFVAVISFGYRWRQVGHVPMQNLFEVFLTFGMMVYPISRFCRSVLRVTGQSVDMLIGVVVLFPAGFVFNADPQFLPPALQSRLFVPHVAVYILSYVFMAKAASQAVYLLVGTAPVSNEKSLSYEHTTYRMISAGFPLLTLGLLLGSWWGKLAWGDYWGWDPKELWSLASWLVYVGYFHFRYMFGKKYVRLNSLWAVMGIVVIIITLLWVNLSELFSGLHSYAT